MLSIGINLGFGKLDPSLSDQQTYAGEVEVALAAERLGYDAVWVVEHHFSDYSLCPDNLLLLAHLAGRTSRIRLGTAAVILPWNDPLRVAEKALMLDTLSGGRLLLGFGRGLSRTEYEPFRIPLDETRDRFDEAAPMIFEALETGFISGDGPFYPQPRTELRPRPRASFHGRRYCVAGSPDSVVTAAALRAHMMSFIVRPVPDLMPTFTRYRELYEAEHGEIAPPIALNVNMYCHTDDALARERHFEHVNRFFMSNVEHYEMAGEHFAGIKGHERYADNAAYFRSIGLEKAADDYAATTLWGSPERILGQIEAVRDAVGDFSLTLAPAFGGMPYEHARDSLGLFAREVLPKARGMRGAAVSTIP
ncbi:LLM class flavin-dependent oxidoreductase [Pseudonocardia humida]|uniref:LLM class flavin-dependent oxidoreductase n=1 Tax=Pseudonocardia humida TaxID=2800819 RepID=A0ABT0ZTN6_9PSEU|nr:LLM class flavin-dependent oxidoreductase [Pseudonocardia humida]MCO1654079.1 LLM class flavin-dependent oxidoreductase [Pseudonocardia humida]